MHILYLHQHFAPPGSSGNNRSLELAENWVRNGHKVTIVCGSGNFKAPLPFYVLYKWYMMEGIQVFRINVDYSHFMSFGQRIWSFLFFLIANLLLSFRFRKVDLLYASSTPITMGLVGLWYTFWWKLKFVFETVDLWPDVPVQMGILKNRLMISGVYCLEKVIYRQASHIVCLSETMQQLILQKGIAPDKISVIHNGTNCKKFKPSLHPDEAKKALGFAASDFVVLYAGTIGVANGLETLIDISLLIKEQQPKIHFLILGDGNRKKQVMEYAKSRGATQVTFLPSVSKNELAINFDAADVGACIFAPYPVLETNSANKWFDYLATGLPVIINYEGWQKAYLEKCTCGFSSRNNLELATCIVRLAADTLLLRQMGQNARTLAVQEFDRKELAEKLLQLFTKISGTI